MPAHDDEAVIIRPWAAGDLSLLERLMGDPAMTEHLGGPESPEKIRERHGRYCGFEAQGRDAMFVILFGSDRFETGSVGYWEREWKGELVWETGWFVLPEYQGRGIAARATALAMERAARDGRHRYVHAFPSVENPASNSICKKLGFEPLGEIDFEYPPGHPMRCNDWRGDLAKRTRRDR